MIHFLLFFTLFIASPVRNERVQEIFEHAGLKGKLEYEVFEKAFQGIASFQPAVTDKLVIFDASQLSTQKRFFVVDIQKEKLLYHTLCAHGKGTGENRATTFSNKPGSLATASGFYLTLGTYQGKHGYSLKLKGLEKGVNDNAESRAIVIHGADYVSEDFIKAQGRIGRSWGCPALPVEVTKEIIDCIKDGVLMYIYAGK
jgi:hypothetical protein